VLYPQLTDNSGVIDGGKIVFLPLYGGGPPHGTQPVVLLVPADHLRLDLPHHPCLVAQPSQVHTAKGPQVRPKRATAPKPSPGSSTHRCARPVSRAPRPISRRPAHPLRSLPSPEDASAPSTAALTAVPLRMAPMTGGLDMAAGLTDRVWCRQEVLMFRVPPWPQPQTISARTPVEGHDVERLEVCSEADREDRMKS
jgi:hypothetical protein